MPESNEGTTYPSSTGSLARRPMSRKATIIGSCAAGTCLTVGAILASNAGFMAPRSDPGPLAGHWRVLSSGKDAKPQIVDIEPGRVGVDGTWNRATFIPRKGSVEIETEGRYAGTYRVDDRNLAISDGKVLLRLMR